MKRNSQFLCGPSTSSLGFSLSVFCITVRLRKKLMFPFEQLSIANSFRLRDGGLCPLPLTGLRPHLCTPVHALCMLPQSL